jgi:NAD(P)H-dependent FMN reductase
MTSAGRSGGAKNLMMLRTVLANCNVTVMLRPEFALSLARQKFDAESGDLMDGEVRKELANFVEKSLEWLDHSTAWKRTSEA